MSQLTSRPTTTTWPSSASQTTRSALLQRLCDYIELTKPKIAVLALVTVFLGYALAGASAGDAQPLWSWKLVSSLLGVALVASASSVFNQYVERDTDRLMQRTANRPLPAGRLSASEVFAFGIICAISGAVLLAIAVNWLTCVLSLATFVLYAGVYTPLKKYTILNTVIGAVPGALPPVLGWTAAGGSLDAGAFSLFAILFLWQFPHFMAIAWLYREDYGRAGMKMLPVTDRTGLITGLTAVGYALALWPVSFQPAAIGLAGNGYLLAASCLGLIYVSSSFRFLCGPTITTARHLLWTSLIYLPALLAAMAVDRWRLLS